MHEYCVILSFILNNVKDLAKKETILRLQKTMNDLIEVSFACITLYFLGHNKLFPNHGPKK